MPEQEFPSYDRPPSYPPVEDLPEIQAAQNIASHHARELRSTAQDPYVTTMLDRAIDERDFIEDAESIPQVARRAVERANLVQAHLEQHLKEHQNDELGNKRLMQIKKLIFDMGFDLQHLDGAKLLDREIMKELVRTKYDLLLEKYDKIMNLWPTGHNSLLKGELTNPDYLDGPAELKSVEAIFDLIRIKYQAAVDRYVQNDAKTAADEMEFHNFSEKYNEARLIVQRRKVEYPDPDNEGEVDDRVRRQLQKILEEMVLRELHEPPSKTETPFAA